MYIGPWQELRAMQRAKAIEVYHNENSQVEEELERLRQAIEMVTNELEPQVASKVRDALTTSRPSSVHSRSSTLSSVSSLTHHRTRQRRRISNPEEDGHVVSRVSLDSEISSSRASTPTHASSCTSRGEDDSCNNSIISNQSETTPGYVLRNERQLRLKANFWRWGDHDNKKHSSNKVSRGRRNKPPRMPRRASDPAARVSKMRQTYLAGVAEQDDFTEKEQSPIKNSKEQTTTTEERIQPDPPPSSFQKQKQFSTKKVAPHFDLTPDQLDIVAKYFGESLTSPPSHTTVEKQVVRTPVLSISPPKICALSSSPNENQVASPLDAVDDLYSGQKICNRKP